MSHSMDGQIKITPGEKFALIALPKVRVAESVTQITLRPGMFVTRDLPFALAEQWQQWIGNIRSKELVEAGFYIVAKLRSSTPDVLDGENQQLMKCVCMFLDSLLLVETPVCVTSPFLLTGTATANGFNVRQLAGMARPVRHAFNQTAIPRELGEQDFCRAASIYDVLSGIVIGSTHIRFKRALSVFLTGVHEARFDERLHQFCRCIDGIVLSGKGSGKRDFKSRTSLFIGSGHEEVADEIYEMRSAVEHLRPAEGEAVNSANIRAQRMRVIERAIQTEIIARHCISQILLSSDLLQRFENDDQIKKFWELPESDRRKAWGGLSFDADLAQAVDEQFVQENDLGLQCSPL